MTSPSIYLSLEIYLSSDRKVVNVSLNLSMQRIGLFQKISTPPPPPPWTTLNWVPKFLRISKKDSGSLCRIPNRADSNSWGIPEFCKILNGFPGIPVKIHKILGKFLESQSGSPSIYYRISNVVHRGGCGYFLE